jgi:hypothetical protein
MPHVTMWSINSVIEKRKQLSNISLAWPLRSVKQIFLTLWHILNLSPEFLLEKYAMFTPQIILVRYGVNSWIPSQSIHAPLYNVLWEWKKIQRKLKCVKNIFLYWDILSCLSVKYGCTKQIKVCRIFTCPLLLITQFEVHIAQVYISIQF